eukprot:scaffold2166_cov100-Skeletonema_marinoi.AAC.5
MNVALQWCSAVSASPIETHQDIYEAAISPLHKMKSWEVIDEDVFWPRCHRLILGISVHMYGTQLRSRHITTE